MTFGNSGVGRRRGPSQVLPRLVCNFSLTRLRTSLDSFFVLRWLLVWDLYGYNLDYANDIYCYSCKDDDFSSGETIS